MKKYAYIFHVTAVLALLPTPKSIAKEPTPTLSEPQTPAVQMIPASFADIAEKLSPAVVNISSTQKSIAPKDFPEMPQFPEGSPFEDFFEDFMDRRGGGAPITPQSALGSGFVIDAEKGYIITNNHVIKGAENVRVTFTDETTVDATIIGTDEKTDIAVLQVDTKDLKLNQVPFGDSNMLRVGDWTLAIGNPFGLGGSVTAGIVSARARDINSGPYDDYIQTDASINRGNSGGPLFNMRGEVIGINTAIFSLTGGSVGIGFSIPSALAQPVINQIIKYGRTRRGWLGVRIQTVTDEIAESLGLKNARGALIASVNDNGPAEKSGLKAGDIILSINDQDIKEMKMLPRIVAENDVGSDAKVTYWRDGKEQETSVKIGELEKAEENGLIETASKSSRTEGFKIESVGLTLKPMNNTIRSEFGIPSSVHGVFISNVIPGSEAEKKGLQAGMIIIDVNQQPVKQPEEIQEIIISQQKNKKRTILLFVEKAGNKEFIGLSLPPSKE